MEAIVGTNANAFKQADPGTVRRLLDKYKDKFAEKGINVSSPFMKNLGRGKMGQAFQIDDGTVLKITGDPSEAKAAKHIQGKNFKNIYKVFAVYQLDSTGYFAIHQEKLEPLPADPQGAQDIDRMVEECMFLYRQEHGMDAINQYLDGQLEGENPQRITLVKELVRDMVNGLNELKQAGIQLQDYHLGNVLYDPKTKMNKFIDIGVSRSGQADIEKIE